MSTRTEQKYRAALEVAGLLEGSPKQLPEFSLLRAAVETALPRPAPPHVVSSVDLWLPLIQRGMERGAGPQAIWDHLRRTQPDFTGSPWAIKRAVQRLEKARPICADDVVIRVETAPGQVGQVDFGFAGRYFDPTTGRIRKAWLFVMVLGYSRHMFGRLAWDQRASTWVKLHVEAFEWFGGVPETLVPDNLKAAVVRAAFGVADRENLALNRTYRELARYYGCKVDPTPVRQPKKKGKVESGIKYVTGNWMRTSEHETLPEGNADLADWVIRVAGERIHGTTGRRPLEAFAEEQPKLLPLPVLPYENVMWKEATVHPDSHIEFERRLYSVPWTHVGRKVWICAKDTTVKVFADEDRVATHSRRRGGRWSTDASHLPEYRRDLANRSEEYWIRRASLMGDAVDAYIRAVLGSDAVLSRLREAQAMVTYLEQFPQERAERACRRASSFGNYSYQGLRGILIRALDLEPLPDERVTFGALDRPRFARHQRQPAHGESE